MGQRRTGGLNDWEAGPGERMDRETLSQFLRLPQLPKSLYLAPAAPVAFIQALPVTGL